MAGKPATQRWVALVGLDWKDPKTGKYVRVEDGEEYAGPHGERLSNEGIVAPAPAGFSQPGNERNEAE